MKVYVAGYRQRRKNRPPADPAKSSAAVEVRFSARREDWLIGTRRLADTELAILRGMPVRHGKHLCQFEIEEQDGEFAIVCRDHSET